jgi:hypothetical protein
MARQCSVRIYHIRDTHWRDCEMKSFGLGFDLNKQMIR